MKYAVLLYQSTDNPLGIPGGWPAETVELSDDVVSLPPEFPVESGWILMTADEFPAQKQQNQAAYSTWYAAQTAGDQSAATMNMIKARILKAMVFGRNMMAEYGARNVLAGFTTAQVTQVANKLAAIQQLLLAGSLYATLEAINNLTPDDLVTQDIINEFRQKIQNYLGIPN